MRYRGRLAIHAAIGHAFPLAAADLDKALADCRATGLNIGAVRASLKAPESWSFGKIIALTELADCVPVEELFPSVVKIVEGRTARTSVCCCLSGNAE